MEVPDVQEVPIAEEAPEAPRPRRRGRTTLLIATAAVLGTVAGTCTGFLVQADREPTRLPSLSQPAVKQAKGEVEPLSAAQDRRVKTDGDLRKLLLKKPSGSKKADWLDDSDGWMSLAAYADAFEKPDGAFSDLVRDEFRRAAVTGWESGNQSVTIRLIQYRQEEYTAASDAANDGQYWADKEDSTDSWVVPGTEDGMAYVHHEPETEPGYLPLYSAQAHAWRGDVAVEVWVYDTKPITKKKIMDLAERQMERL
ncbi:hypothetical protein HLK59_30070 [Streptomyces sp. S3(2020)]|uniref:hypothetical protein n=1 Tax=Streptomyces sp. S3(2020) TaxID=2732044 RepID=UPI00148975C2|nr:hypothetical protein [Streptomyces sp. S3(2020)]NNN34534.1 hypothetical protein [Streptomyces sp. S3(2020)]